MKTLLIILDGFGINHESPEENAITQAYTPYFDSLFAQHHAKVTTHGRIVGLPDGQMGNSEVGHTTIGSGRTLKQSLVAIEDLFSEGDFEQTDEFQDMITYARENNNQIHLMGVFGPGGVHGDSAHMNELINIIPGDIDIALHLFGDGRDVAPKSMRSFLENFELPDNVHIASICGRYYAMDRDNNWERIKRTYDMLTHVDYLSTEETPSDYIQSEYDKGVTDEFLTPTRFSDTPISDGDAVFFTNFRADRARQITKSFIDEDFDGFERDKLDVHYVSMHRYYDTQNNPTILKPETPKNTLAEWISKQGKTQLHTAETEKYAHVTFFFNGGVEEPHEGQTNLLVNSPKVATYDLQPEMSSQEVHDNVVNEAHKYDFTVVNFANPDMVGHCGSMAASIATLEKLDTLVQSIVEYAAKHNIEIILTADHGNIEKMGTEENPHTAHTTYPVPLWHISQGGVMSDIVEEGDLTMIAPTVLEFMDIEVPDEMNKKSFLQ